MKDHDIQRIVDASPNYDLNPNPASDAVSELTSRESGEPADDGEPDGVHRDFIEMSEVIEATNRIITSHGGTTEWWNESFFTVKHQHATVASVMRTNSGYFYMSWNDPGDIGTHGVTVGQWHESERHTSITLLTKIHELLDLWSTAYAQRDDATHTS